MPSYSDDGALDSQCWLVLAFVCTEWMTPTKRAGQTRKAGCTAATMLALILGFFSAFIQSVPAFVRAIRVAGAQGTGQVGDAVGFVAAMFAVGIHDVI